MGLHIILKSDTQLTYIKFEVGSELFYRQQALEGKMD